MTNGTCHLCGQNARIVNSHVWPSFAYKRYVSDQNKGGQFLDLQKRNPNAQKQYTMPWFAHNKVMVIDGQTVITGSFNFTKAAENNNAENLLVIRDKEIADKYAANWKVHADHSEQYEQKEKGYSETHNTAEEAPDAAEGYVASKNSAVFHKSKLQIGGEDQQKEFDS
jgi:phosphatidylserine/phosphatidylglycerophosphate/cardiolipin synthase-like enzyme